MTPDYHMQPNTSYLCYWLSIRWSQVNAAIKTTYTRRLMDEKQAAQRTKKSRLEDGIQKKPQGWG